MGSGGCPYQANCKGVMCGANKWLSNFFILCLVIKSRTIKDTYLMNSTQFIRWKLFLTGPSMAPLSLLAYASVNGARVCTCGAGGWRRCAVTCCPICPTRCPRRTASCCARLTTRRPSRGSSASPSTSPRYLWYDTRIMYLRKSCTFCAVRCVQRGVRDADLAGGVLPQRPAGEQHPVPRALRCRRARRDRAAQRERSARPSRLLRATAAHRLRVLLLQLSRVRPAVTHSILTLIIAKY